MSRDTPVPARSIVASSSCATPRPCFAASRSQRAATARSRATNNGYEVVNLGIKVPPEQLIEAYRKENPDMIGLSGLLVKSAQQMVLTAQDLKEAGIEVPILVGGAALTRKFTQQSHRS